MIDYRAYYQGVISRQRMRSGFVTGILIVVFIAATLAKDALVLMAAGSVAIAAAGIFFYMNTIRKYQTRLRLLEGEFPIDWDLYLKYHSVYYDSLNGEEQHVFAMRVLFFFEEVRIDGIDTDADERIKLLVAASAIIPTFAFPYFEYPNLRNVLVYPEAFNERFETDSIDRDDAHNSGMVGTGFMNYTVLLSKRELLAGFSGTRNRRNVGIHEFVHLLDKADGSIDGVPAILMDHASVPAWLELVDREMDDLERGRSDIDSYGLTDRGEFFAVACEYFFNNPEKFRENHPELHAMLCTIFAQTPPEGGA